MDKAKALWQSLSLDSYYAHEAASFVGFLPSANRPSVYTLFITRRTLCLLTGARS